MSEKTKIPWEIAMPVAEEIVERLKPCCLRIAIAGSLRRLKKQVGDIEILFVPRMTDDRGNPFIARLKEMCDTIIFK